MTAFGAGNSVASDGKREFSHHFTLGANAVLFGAIIAYVGKHTKPGKWGAFVMLTIGSLLLAVDPTRHVLLDHNGVFFKPESIAMFNEDGTLSLAGRTSQLCTVFGLLLLVLGIFSFLGYDQKIKGLFGNSKLQ